jgi:dolichol kinase
VSHVDADAEEIPFRAEVARKLLHLVALIIPVAALIVGRSAATWLLIPLATLAVAADVVRTRNLHVNNFIERYLGFMMRPVERPGVGGPIILNGATCVLLSAAILTVLFPLNIGMTAFIVFMIADAAAAIVGRRVGRYRWPGTSRTVEGSMAFLLTGLTLYYIWGGVAMWAVAVIVIAGAAAEILPRPFNDNIRVPLVMGGVAFVLDYFFAVMASPVLL